MIRQRNQAHENQAPFHPDGRPGGTLCSFAGASGEAALCVPGRHYIIKVEVE
ncbi:hypothetical protein HMPREF1146_2481 [Prevotella sp. MSX73]|nr:hypothetical protein HMPREF1146_2481 [Prevotella sp. MSX73]